MPKSKHLNACHKRRPLVFLLLLPSISQAQFPEFLEATVSWTGDPNDSAGHGSADVQPVFLFIPGAILGSPDESRPFITITSLGAGEIQFPLFLIRDEADDAAMALSQAARASGLRVSPEATRFARVATFFFIDGEDYSGGAGFLERNSGYVLVLIYVDRPSEFSGSSTSGGMTLTYDFSFERAGFHWIRARSSGGVVSNAPTDVEVTYASPNSIADQVD